MVNGHDIVVLYRVVVLSSENAHRNDRTVLCTTITTMIIRLEELDLHVSVEICYLLRVHGVGICNVVGK